MRRVSEPPNMATKAGGLQPFRDGGEHRHHRAGEHDVEGEDEEVSGRVGVGAGDEAARDRPDRREARDEEVLVVLEERHMRSRSRLCAKTVDIARIAPSPVDIDAATIASTQPPMKAFLGKLASERAPRPPEPSKSKK